MNRPASSVAGEEEGFLAPLGMTGSVQAAEGDERDGDGMEDAGGVGGA